MRNAEQFRADDVEDHFSGLDHARWGFATGDYWRSQEDLESFLLHDLQLFAECWHHGRQLPWASR